MFLHAIEQVKLLVLLYTINAENKIGKTIRRYLKKLIFDYSLIVALLFYCGHF